MRKLETQEIEELVGGNRCEFYTWMLIGVGITLSTSVVAAPLGIVIGGVGAASYFGGGCG